MSKTPSVSWKPGAPLKAGVFFAGAAFVLFFAIVALDTGAMRSAATISVLAAAIFFAIGTTLGAWFEHVRVARARVALRRLDAHDPLLLFRTDTTGWVFFDDHGYFVETDGQFAPYRDSAARVLSIELAQEPRRIVIAAQVHRARHAFEIPLPDDVGDAKASAAVTRIQRILAK